MLETLLRHVGAAQVISRQALLDNLAARMSEWGIAKSRQDRSLRLAIRQLRKSGFPICSTGGYRGGYYIAANLLELEEYLTMEVHSRAIDLLQQEKEMRAGASTFWGAQPPLL